MTIKTKLEQAENLLLQVAEKAAELPLMDRDWWKNYYLFTGQHMILTEEGWEDGSAKQSYIDSLEPNEGIADVMFDEVNAPKHRGRPKGSKNAPKAVDAEVSPVTDECPF